MMTGEKNRWQVMWDFIFGDRKNLRPQDSIPVIHTDLKRLPKEQNLMVWFGHSSYMIQIDGKRILVDPVFCKASPVSFINKPFSGTDIYRPEDMPEIDLLIITHDHWDHLDYETVTALQEKVAKVVCPLGIGEDFEYWGYDSDKLIELDWSEHTILDNIDVHCLPARHFSGRGLASNKTLWASYMIESPSTTIFIGGDGGYGPHFKEIGESFTNIDWAILENGQYNNDWKNVAMQANANPLYVLEELSSEGKESRFTELSNWIYDHVDRSKLKVADQREFQSLLVVCYINIMVTAIELCMRPGQEEELLKMHNIRMRFLQEGVLNHE